MSLTAKPARRRSRTRRAWPRAVVPLIALVAVASGAAAQPAPQPTPQSASRTRTVVLVVTDGLRWQEVFGGAERALISGVAGGVADTAETLRAFWRETPEARRAALFPFLWGTVAREGQIHGDPEAGSVARTRNPLKFSYPGYNELLTGAYDPRIDSNDHPPNPNETVFEALAQRPGFRGRVAAVATWGAFRRIFNRDRAGIPVLDGWDVPFASPTSPRQRALNDVYGSLVRPWPDNAFDGPMHLVAREVLATRRPRLLFIGYGETDEWAHAGRYDLLLQAAHRVDAFLADLWAALQADPATRGTTTLLVTTDHGRGAGLHDWKHHGRDVDGADRIWLAAIGPDTPPRGRRVRTPVVEQAQLAATVAALFGLDWPARHPGAAPAVAEVLGLP